MIGPVALRVQSLEESLAFYRGLLGLAWRGEDSGTLAAPDGGAPLLCLTERPGLVREGPDAPGLYHVALRVPTRRDLAHAFVQLDRAGWPLTGFADHLVSEALYLADPDGLGLEIYADRPRDEWTYRDGELVMATRALDVRGLAAALGPNPVAGPTLGARTEMGHIHLHVTDLDRAEAFYAGVLGMDVTTRRYPGARFFSWRGYHHHIGNNVWAAARQPWRRDASVGLEAFTVMLPSRAAREAMVARAGERGYDVSSDADPPWVRDADGLTVALDVGA